MHFFISFTKLYQRKSKHIFFCVYFYLTTSYDKTISSFFIAEEHNILILELIERGYINENDTQIFYYGVSIDLLNKNNSYKDLLCIIHYIVPRIVKRKFKDENDNLIENKYGYFKNAIESNIRKLNTNIENLWGEDEYNLWY